MLDFWLCHGLLPEGTNHLSGVEILAGGEIWRTPFDTNAIASIGTPVSIVPGVTTFGVEHSPSNSYVVSWFNAAVNRDTNNLTTAPIELFRNGDIAVTTNGVTTFTERELPFAHIGFGQDAEWVTANFTNATEILAMGYQQWVDAQVGEGLTNGLFKFTATFPDDPPETIQLVVGDSSIAVTNAGDYVFLLEKGVEYEYGTIPFLTNVTYSAVDDVPQGAGTFLETTWHTRRLMSNGVFEEWQLASYAHSGTSLAYTPTLGGVYQICALASVEAGGVDERYYIWDDDNDDLYGLCEGGQLKAIGVANEQWQIDLRNCALAYIVKGV